MTCIAAVVHEGAVFMAADSAGVDGLQLHVRKDPKIYRVGEFLFGFTTSFRMGQVLGYGFVPPCHHKDVPMERYMADPFVAALRAAFKTAGYARVNEGVESGGRFLVGYSGRVFLVDYDFHVGESTFDFNAVGCGAELALGALHATRGRPPLDRLQAAMSAAEQFSAGVRGPFQFEALAGEPPEGYGGSA